MINYYRQIISTDQRKNFFNKLCKEDQNILWSQLTSIEKNELFSYKNQDPDYKGCAYCDNCITNFDNNKKITIRVCKLGAEIVLALKVCPINKFTKKEKR